MRTLTGKKDTTWHWIGVILVCISVLFLEISILAGIDQGELGSAFFFGIIAITITMGLGIICIQHAGKHWEYLVYTLMSILGLIAGINAFLLIVIEPPLWVPFLCLPIMIGLLYWGFTFKLRLEKKLESKKND